MANKGLKRFAFFVVFLIPVGWYLFLQLFGSNTFKLSLMERIPENCQQFKEISVIYRTASVAIHQQNYFDRVRYQVTNSKAYFLPDTTTFFSCLQNEDDLLLVNKEGLWGAYKMDREGVDQLLTELDILLIQNSYGKGVDR